MRDWKYIMVQVGNHRYPILFPQELVHRYVGQGIERAIMMDRDHPRDGIPEIVSAGFVSGLHVLKAHGESESLGIKSHPDDTTRINNDFLRHQDPEPLITSAADAPADLNRLAEKSYRDEFGPDSTEPNHYDPNRGRTPRNYGTWDRPKSFSQDLAERRRQKRLAEREKK